MKEKVAQGIGVVVNQAKFIREEQENFLWENGFLGSENGFWFGFLAFSLL